MPLTHLLLALLVVLVWGFNFLFVKLGLNEIPPLLLCALRFILASIPAIFFIKPPSAPFKIVALYGLVMFALQFAFIFTGMHVGMTAGMASVILQIQVFFSMFFAAVLLDERPTIWQIAGACVSFMGIVVVALHFDKTISLLGFICIIAAAITWGIGNLITKKIQYCNKISLVVWGSLVASIPMLAACIILEKPSSMLYSYHHVTSLGILSVLYIVYASTWVGYGIWNWLLSRYTISMVAPFTLLVPIIAVLASVLFLGESLLPWKLMATLLVIGGLCINVFGARLFMPKVQPSSPPSQA